MSKFRLIMNYLLSFLPSPLPVGATAYDKWLLEIQALVGPIADEMSIQWVISQEIMRLNPGRDRVPKRLFVKLLRKYAANQIAANKVLELKKRQEEISKAAQQAEVTATPVADVEKA